MCPLISKGFRKHKEDALRPGSKHDWQAWQSASSEGLAPALATLQPVPPPGVGPARYPIPATMATLHMPLRPAGAALPRRLGSARIVPAAGAARAAAQFGPCRDVAGRLTRRSLRRDAPLCNQRRQAEELLQHAVSLFRSLGFLPASVSARSRGFRALFEHPSREKREGRFLHQFVKQDTEFAAEVGHVFQFGHLEVAKGSVGTFPKVFHRRFRKPSHWESPGIRAMVISTPRPASVTDLAVCAKQVLPVEISPAPPGDSPTGASTVLPIGG